MKEDLKILYDIILTLFEGDEVNFDDAIDVMVKNGFEVNEEGYIIEED
ncbi:hypothetical protein ABEY43_07285 [Priestia megaterium]